MTLANSQIRLELAKKREDAKEITFWEEKVARLMKHPKYAHLLEEIVEVKRVEEKKHASHSNRNKR